MPHQVERAPRRWFNQSVATARLSYTKIALLLGIVIVAVVVVLGPTVLGRFGEMPAGAGIIVGQQQGLFYLVTPAPDRSSELYISRDGRDWHRLPAVLPGTVQTLAINRMSPPIIYAATSAGLFVTANGGLNWSAISMPPMTVTALAADPSVADMVYVATTEPALYHMTDLGTSRRRVAAQGLEQRQIRHIVISPTNSQVVLARTDQGLYRSNTAGEQWAPIRGAPGSISTLVFVPGATPLWIAGTQDAGVYRSLDDGRTWQPANVGIASSLDQNQIAVTALTVDPRSPDRLYLATAPDQAGMAAPAIYVSTDRGTSWVKVYDGAPDAGVITALVPTAANAIRTVTPQGVRTYTVDVDGALAGLDSPRTAERLHAARLLSVMALPDQTYALLEHLDDSDPRVGQYLARAIVRTGDSAIWPELVRHAQTGTLTARRRAIAALGELHAFDAVPALTHILRTDADLAPASAEALAAMGTEQAWWSLRAGLRSGATAFQREAVSRAFRNAGEPAVPALVIALHDGDPFVRVRAARLLADIGSPRAIPALRELLNDDSPRAQAAAIDALGTLGDIHSRPVLAQLGDAGHTQGVRQAAAQAIAQIDKNPRLPPYDVLRYPSPTRPADIWRTIGLIVPWLVITVLLFIRREHSEGDVQTDEIAIDEVDEEVS